MSLPFSTSSLYYNSPLGVLCLKADDMGLCGLDFTDVPIELADIDETMSNNRQTILATCCHELDLYFLGKLTVFSVPLHLSGTVFRLRVWNELQKIPYGATISYLELARRLGDERAIRAVGTANGHNPIGIIVPCHRVIGSSGQLTGYAGGLWRKQWLLEWEGALGPSLF